MASLAAWGSRLCPETCFLMRRVGALFQGHAFFAAPFDWGALHRMEVDPPFKPSATDGELDEGERTTEGAAFGLSMTRSWVLRYSASCAAHLPIARLWETSRAPPHHPLGSSSRSSELPCGCCVPQVASR